MPIAAERLQATFEAAMDFGLSDEQVWKAAREVAESTPVDQPAGECMDEVGGNPGRPDKRGRRA